LKDKGHTASRSPNGICIRTLAEFVGASEQICRRYIRGVALPDYEKIIDLAIGSISSYEEKRKNKVKKHMDITDADTTY